METAEQIRDAALAAFYAHGFHAMGVDQLSRLAGVTKRTLYKHFASKEALIEAVLQERDRRFMARLRGYLEAYPVAERPAAYLNFIAEWSASADFRGCMFINASAEYGDPESVPHRVALAHKQQLQAYLCEVLAASGREAPVQAAAHLFLLGEGLTVAAQVMGSQPALIEAARRAFQGA